MMKTTKPKSGLSKDTFNPPAIIPIETPSTASIASNAPIKLLIRPRNPNAKVSAPIEEISEIVFFWPFVLTKPFTIMKMITNSKAKIG